MRLWLRDHESEFDRFDYNVRLGPGRDPGADYPEYVRKTAILSSQMRLDCVAWRGDRPTILELKGFALPTAVQQLALYGAVWNAEHPAATYEALLLVCAGSAPGVTETAAAANITVQVVNASA